MKSIGAYQGVWRRKDVLLLLLLTLVCYWPLSTGIFAAKNDNITQFLPTRFHVSEALRHFHLPTWTPYMYLGYPIGGDMQGGAWNPVVWLLSVFGRYSITSLHAEILIYIFLSGLGMYRLLAALRLDGAARLGGATAYLMCGYITDVAGSNAPFLAAAAGTPFVFAYFVDLFRRPVLSTAVKAGCALSLLFTTAYPSFFICTSYVVLAGFLAALLVQKTNARSIFLYTAAAALVFLLVSAPAIIAYAQILPHYGRGEGISLELAQQNAFVPAASWSYLLPAYTVKDPALAATDLISRNGYFHLVLLLTLPLSYRFLSRRLFFFLLSGWLFFFLFSLGEATPVRAMGYRALPLIDTFRHPSNARLYVILAGIILGSAALRGLLQKDRRTIRRILAAGSLVMLLLLAFLKPPPVQEAFNQWAAGRLSREELKLYLDHLLPAQLAWINTLVHLLLLIALAVSIRGTRQRWFWGLFLLHSLLVAQLTIPFTVVTKASPRAINTLLRTVPSGYPAPDLRLTIGRASADSLANSETWGIGTFYSKNIAATRLYFTPTYPSLLDSFYADAAAVDRVMGQPFAFADRASVAVREMNNHRLVFSVEAQAPTALQVRQLRLPYWQCRVNGNPQTLRQDDVAFLAVGLPAGQHEVVLEYCPPFIRIALFLSLASLAAGLFLIFKSKRNVVER